MQSSNGGFYMYSSSLVMVQNSFQLFVLPPPPFMGFVVL